MVATQNVIVVSINYRLNVFGFMHLADSDATGNAGFLDQNLAMKWVYENAKAFGGDNSKITIFGESAGSWSVGFHLFYQQSWKYFRNAILESGAPTGRSYSTNLLIRQRRFCSNICYLFQITFISCHHRMIPPKTLRVF